MSRRSLTYETRLFKYANRGFAVGVPGLETKFIDHTRFRGKQLHQCSGNNKQIQLKITINILKD